MPTPVSLTSTWTTESSAHVLTRSRPPSVMASLAFKNRFRNTC